MLVSPSAPTLGIKREGEKEAGSLTSLEVVPALRRMPEIGSGTRVVI
jgi:hypothetical protein